MDVNQESLKLHEELRGKIEVVARRHIETRDDLSLLYTPGVAEPCREIAKDYEKSFTLTRRSNLVAVITDGSAVLGLGDIGPAAGMPVMEGKCALFKEFGGVDAFPICVDTKDVDKLVETIALISKSFGGINLEDIAAPRCFEVERRLKEVCDIPVFHDDQHGTAIVVAAALLNALKALSGAGGHGVHLIKQSAIEPIQTVKVKYLGSNNPRLHSDEVLVALAASANLDAKALAALRSLAALNGCQAHCSVILSPPDESTYKKLGLQLTCEPQYQTNNLYHR